jgi:hypothetical protein
VPNDTEQVAFNGPRMRDSNAIDNRGDVSLAEHFISSWSPKLTFADGTASRTNCCGNASKENINN